MSDGNAAERERWKQRYQAPGYLFGTEPNALLKSQAHLCAGARPHWLSPMARAATACS
jgi:hypothetical protein